MKAEEDSASGLKVFDIRRVFHSNLENSDYPGPPPGSPTLASRLGNKLDKFRKPGKSPNAVQDLTPDGPLNSPTTGTPGRRNRKKVADGTPMLSPGGGRSPSTGRQPGVTPLTEEDMTGWQPITLAPEKPPERFKRRSKGGDPVAAEALGGEEERLARFGGVVPLNDTQARLAAERTKKPPEFTFKTYVKPKPVFLDKPTHVHPDETHIKIPDAPFGPQHGPLYSADAEKER